MSADSVERGLVFYCTKREHLGFSARLDGYGTSMDYG